MKRVFKGSNVIQPVLIIAILFFTVFQSKGQQLKPAASGYAPVNGIKNITARFHLLRYGRIKTAR